MCYFDDSANWDAENAADALPDIDLDALLSQMGAAEMQTLAFPVPEPAAAPSLQQAPPAAHAEPNATGQSLDPSTFNPSTEESQPVPGASRPKRKTAGGASGPSKSRRPDESEGEALDDIEEARRQKRLVKNRLTALRSRQRKKAEFEMLRDRVAQLEAENRRITAELAARDALLGQLRTNFGMAAATGWGHAPAATSLLATGHLPFAQASQLLTGQEGPLLRGHKGGGNHLTGSARPSTGASANGEVPQAPARAPGAPEQLFPF